MTSRAIPCTPTAAPSRITSRLWTSTIRRRPDLVRIATSYAESDCPESFLAVISRQQTILGHDQFVDGHAEQFLARVAGGLNGRFISGRESPTQVVQINDVAGILEQLAVLRSLSRRARSMARRSASSRSNSCGVRATARKARPGQGP